MTRIILSAVACLALVSGSVSAQAQDVIQWPIHVPPGAAIRTDNRATATALLQAWNSTSSTYTTLATLTAGTTPVWVFGSNVRLPASAYLNWGTTAGSGGYGIRDNAGTVECKDSGGAWAACAAGTAYFSRVGTVLSPATAGDTLNLGTAALTSGAATIQGLTVGLGVNAVAGNTAVGVNALRTGTLSGGNNTGVGNAVLYNLTAGTFNAAVGQQAGSGITTGSTNVAIGASALLGNQTGAGNVAIGYLAGSYETGSNAFYVDNQNRTNTAGDKTGALLYGTFNATPASQTLTVNGTLTVSTLAGADQRYVCASTAGLLVVSDSACHGAEPQPAATPEQLLALIQQLQAQVAELQAQLRRQ
jgi:hypothetical protein